jgi:hypothetical protein
VSDRQPPAGYDEIGEPLAQAVLEGVKPESWALELAKTLGYDKADLANWLAFYRRANRESLRWLETKRSRRRSKIERLRKQAADLADGG